MLEVIWRAALNLLNSAVHISVHTQTLAHLYKALLRIPKKVFALIHSSYGCNSQWFVVSEKTNASRHIKTDENKLFVVTN